MIVARGTGQAVEPGRTRVPRPQLPLRARIRGRSGRPVGDQPSRPSARRRSASASSFWYMPGGGGRPRRPAPPSPASTQRIRNHRDAAERTASSRQPARKVSSNSPRGVAGATAAARRRAAGEKELSSGGVDDGRRARTWATRRPVRISSPGAGLISTLSMQSCARGRRPAPARAWAGARRRGGGRARRPRRGARAPQGLLHRLATAVGGALEAVVVEQGRPRRRRSGGHRTRTCGSRAHGRARTRRGCSPAPACRRRDGRSRTDTARHASFGRRGLRLARAARTRAGFSASGARSRRRGDWGRLGWRVAGRGARRAPVGRVPPALSATALAPAPRPPRPRRDDGLATSEVFPSASACPCPSPLPLPFGFRPGRASATATWVSLAAAGTGGWSAPATVAAAAAEAGGGLGLLPRRLRVAGERFGCADSGSGLDGHRRSLGGVPTYRCALADLRPSPPVRRPPRVRVPWRSRPPRPGGDMRLDRHPFGLGLLHRSRPAARPRPRPRRGSAALRGRLRPRRQGRGGIRARHPPRRHHESARCAGGTHGPGSSSAIANSCASGRGQPRPGRVTKMPDFSSRPSSSRPRACASSSRLPKARKPK